MKAAYWPRLRECFPARKPFFFIPLQTGRGICWRDTLVALVIYFISWIYLDRTPFVPL